MPLMPNEVYDIRNPKLDTVRIVSVLPDQMVVVISLINKDTLPYELPAFELEEAIESKDAIINSSYPPVCFANPTDKQIEMANNRWGIIGNFVKCEPDCYDQKIRSRFISARSRELGIERKQIYRLLYRYWAGGKTLYALYPEFEKRGAPGKPRISIKKLGRPVQYTTNNQRVTIGDTELKHIHEAITKYYTKHTKYSYRYAYRKMIEEHYTDPNTSLLEDVYPTENQFRYHALQFVDVKKRFGSVKYNKDMRGITGSSRSEANGPGDVYQIDATVADIYLVSHNDSHAVVGRPELYFVTDVFSRMIVGFYVCLESASWDNARIALLNSFMDKVKLCKSHDINILHEDWPCEGLPRALIVDNGELISKASNTIISGLGITVKNAPAWRPDLKGIVESRFRLLNINVKAILPGAVLPDFAQRGGQDYRLDAKLNLTEFTQIVIHFILNHNRRPMEEHPQMLPDIMADNVPPIPIELWKWGIKNRTGTLQKMDLEDMTVALAQKATAMVTRKGIKFHNLFYNCDTAVEQDWFSKVRNKESQKIEIAYQPKEMSKIYWLKGPKEYEVCNRTKDSGEHFPGESFEEVVWGEKHRSRQKAAYTDIGLQSEVDTNRAISDIIRKADAKTKLVSIDKAKIKVRPDDIRKNRKAEAEMIRAKKKAIIIGSESETVSDMTKSAHKDKSSYSAMFAEFLDEEVDE